MAQFLPRSWAIASGASGIVRGDVARGIGAILNASYTSDR